MAAIISRNILSNLPAAKKKEVFQVFARGKNFKIERIISCGQTTPEGSGFAKRLPSGLSF